MPKNDRELVQIEANEDANSVRDRLSFIRGSRVLLVWPEDGTALKRKLDLVLIQREAMRRSIRLAIVTHDAEVMRHARELNISTFETIGASERGRWKRGRSKVFTNRAQKPKSEPDHHELIGVASRIRIARPSLPPLHNALLKLLILVLVLGIVGAASYIVVPGADVTLAPATQTIEASVQITVNPDPDFTTVDVENAVLPATLLRIEIEDTASMPTTGSRNLGSSPALGTVMFINETEQDIEIPLGTTVSTSAGSPIMFRTIAAAVLPGGQGRQVEVPIEAMPGSAGGVGNVAENLINTVIGPLAESLTVRNLTPTTGGQSRVVQVVSEDDRTRLRSAMRQQLQERAFNEMQALPQVREDDLIIIETLRIVERDDWIQFDAETGDIADSLSLTMRAIVEAVVVDGQIGQQIVFAKMANQIPRGRIINPDTINYTRGDVVFTGSLIVFTMSGRGTVSGQINTDQLRDHLAGRTLDDAMDYLLTRVDLAEGSMPEITITPTWIKRLPVLPMRITINIVGSEGPVP